MVNKPKARGTAAETAVVRYVRQAGFPHAERLTLAGVADRGDIALVPGPAAILEVKSYAEAAAGQIGPGLLATWLAETERERIAAQADVAALIVKRAGTTDVGRWWSYWRLGDFLRLVGAPDVAEGVAADTCGAWCCLMVDSTLALLRHAGYGAPLETDLGDVLRASLRPEHGSSVVGPRGQA